MAAATPVLDKVFIVLLVIFITGEVFELLIPVTLPPVDERLLMMLLEMLSDVAVLTVDPMVIPVIFPPPVIFVTVLLESTDTPFRCVKFIAFTVPVPAVQLFKIFPVTVLDGAVPPSE